MTRDKCSASSSPIFIKDHVTMLPFIFKCELCELRWVIGNIMRLFKSWKPKGKMYSLKCNQCGEGFLSSYQLEAPICGKCLQKAKSLDSTIEHEKQCLTCGTQGVIYGKEYCYSCYFGFGKKQRMNAWVHVVAKILLINRKYRKPYDYLARSSIRFESFYLKFLWAYVAETILATSYIQKD
jgi:ribosomal protein L37E